MTDQIQKASDEQSVVRKVADPTSLIVSHGDNEAEATRLRPATTGEASGYSPVEHAPEEDAKRLMTNEELEAAKRDWLDNPILPQEVVVVSTPSPSMLMASYAVLLGLGAVLGALAYAILTNM